MTCAIKPKKKKITVIQEVKKKPDDSVKTYQRSILTLLSSVLCDTQVGLDYLCVFMSMCLLEPEKNFFQL